MKRDQTEERTGEPAGRKSFGKRAATVVLCILLTASVLTGRTLGWVMSQVHVNLDEILYTLRHPVNGTDEGIIRSILLYAALPALAVLFAVLSLRLILDRWF